MPDERSREVSHDGRGRVRTPAQREAALAQLERSRWRGLALVVRAKLEAVAMGVRTWDEEWIAAVVMPDGRTVAETVGGELDAATRNGGLPPRSLLGLPERTGGSGA
jgi:hypothetical protein